MPSKFNLDIKVEWRKGEPEETEPCGACGDSIFLCGYYLHLVAVGGKLTTASRPFFALCQACGSEVVKTA